MNYGKARDFGPGHKAPKTPVGDTYTRDLLQMLEWNDSYRKSDEFQRFEADRVRRESLAQVATPVVQRQVAEGVIQRQEKSPTRKLTATTDIRALALEVYSHLTGVSEALKERILRKANWRALLDPTRLQFAAGTEVATPAIGSRSDLDAFLRSGDFDDGASSLQVEAGEGLSQIADRLIRTHGLSEVSPQDHRDLVWQLSVRNGIRNERGGRTLLEAGWTLYIDNKITTRRGRMIRLGREPRQTVVWPGGPRSRRKSVDHRLDDYVRWIQTFESVYGASERDAPRVVSRLRRMYFSRYSGVAGARFEQLLRTPEEPPASNTELDQETLDRLYETNQIVTPSGKIDPSHIFAMLDLELTGATVLGEGRHTADNIAAAGTVTWVGDLASWFTEWNVRRKALIPRELGQAGEFDLDRLFYSLADSKVSREDLLSDMDAQILARQRIDRRAMPAIPPGQTMLHVSLQGRVSEIFSQYYASAPADGGRRRFEAFIQSARPAIPFRTEGGRPVIIRAEARQKIFQNLQDTANLFRTTNPYERISSTVVTSDEVAMHAGYIWKITDHFLDFLEEGLRSGRAQWPPQKR